MKQRLLIGLIVLFPVGLFLFFWLHPGVVKTSPGPEIPGAAPASTNSGLSPSASHTNTTSSPPASASAGVAAPAGASVSHPAAALQFTNFAPATVIQNMSRAIRQYGERFGGNPVGTNPEITRQLSGLNPKHLNFITAEAGMRINGNGELVDPWGTPYFFHQLSGHEMEIHSAGPDQIMWTADDLVTK
jgi:hypothetical protein